MKNTPVKKSLQERAKEMTVSLPLMEGREHGELDRILDTNVTIREFGFMADTDKDGKEKEYVAFIVDEDPQYFYFGGQVLTDNMREFENDGYHEEIVKDGLPVLLSKKKSKNKREYTTVTFYPEA
jgi:predicted metallo-beta-lactamase superfamily hydrolase